MNDSNDSYGLTKREREILDLLADGMSNKQIAERLGLTVRTVKFHTCNIYSRLGVNSRSEAIALIWRQRRIQYTAEQ